MKKKQIVLDANIFYNIIMNEECKNEIYELLKGYEILVTDLTIYELSNHNVDLTDLNISNIVKICNIKCLGKGLNQFEVDQLNENIMCYGEVNHKLYRKMRNLYLSMICPIMDIFLFGYINMIGPLIKICNQGKMKEELHSKKFINLVKKDIKKILEEINPQRLKHRFYNKVKEHWMYFLYKYGLENPDSIVSIKSLLKTHRLNDIFGISIYSKKGKEISNIIEKDFDSNIFPILKNKYNGFLANYIKILYLTCFIEKGVIELNSIFDALILSVLGFDVVLCTDDKKMIKFIKNYNRYDEICDKIIEIKKKYD